MENSCFRARHGRQVVRAGAVLFLLAVLTGFIVSRFAIPRLGLSAHLLGVSQAILLLASGQLWGRLALGPALSRAAASLLVAGCGSAWVANLAAAAWGAGGVLLTQAAGAAARGSALQELIILISLRGGGVAIVVGWLLLVWGLRGGGEARTGAESERPA